MTLSRKSLLTIYKSFVRPLLDYADIIYDKPYNELFKEKLEPVQYNACLAITGTIRGTSHERLYRKLRLEILNNRRWSRKLFFFHEIIKGFSPSHVQKILCFRNVQHYQTRSKSTKIIEQIKARIEIRNIESSKQFKKTILDFIRPKENSICAIHDISGLKLTTRLRLNFSHLNEHNFRHNFKDTISPMCSCSFEPETADHDLLRCKLYTDLS